MALFGFGSRKPKAPARPAPDERLVKVIYERACDYVVAPDRRIHVEDLLSALAAVTGEACLRAAGEVDVGSHAYAPGSLVFSDAVNRLLCADAQRWEEVPPDSVYGEIYRQALAADYDPQAFPPLPDVFALLARAAGGGGVEWGWVPLSTTDSAPFTPPLQAAYDLRGRMNEAMGVFGIPRADQPRACAFAVAKALAAVREAINQDVAISIVVETINGMAKTAPMTPAHFAQTQQSAASA